MTTILVTREEIFTELTLTEGRLGTGPMEAILRGLGKAIDKSTNPLPSNLKFEFEDQVFTFAMTPQQSPLDGFDDFALEEELRRRRGVSGDDEYAEPDPKY